MQTRAQQTPISLLQQQEQQALSYFLRWHIDTPLTIPSIHDLQRMHLLAPPPSPCDCGAALTLCTSTRGVDKHEYRCPTHGSRTHRSIRQGSWFYHRTRSISTYIIAVRMLSSGLSQHHIAEETQLHPHTLHALYRELVDGMVVALHDHVYRGDQPLFPCHSIVEVDETHMRWRGALLTGEWEEVQEHEGGVWVLGIISRKEESRGQDVMLFCVEGRSREDLVELIEEHVEPHTLICSDALAAYTALSENYRHHVINKAVEGFARQGWDRMRGHFTVTVNTCERMWGRLRELGRQRRLNRPSDVPLLCTEFEFRHYHLPWFALLCT
jgi:hypothetical protein